jgi:diguanylate cyclase (GGDEF)-like protein
MGTPDPTLPRAPSARPSDRRLLRQTVTAPRANDEILGRRDVAILPWVAICIASAMIALSTYLRRPAEHVDQLVLFGSLGVAAFSGIMAAIQDTWIGLKYRGALWVYLLGSNLLLAALAALGIRDEGLDTVFYAGNVMVAEYLGLVFPTRWALRSFALMVIVTIAVHAINPHATPFEGVVAISMIIAGFLVGMLGRLAHSRAGKIAKALSSYDRLTSMLNRRGLLQQLDAVLADRAKSDTPMALLIVDLDGFKQVNDVEGHAAGDAILAWVGEALPSALPECAELGRLGGDEFAVLLTETRADEAEAVAHAIRAALAERIGASIGVATTETRAVAPDDLFRVADAALYQCKRDRSLGVQMLVAGSAGSDLPPQMSRASRRGDAPLSYARLRATGKAPRTPESGVVYGWMLVQGLLVIAAAGAVVVAGALISGPGHGFYTDVLRYLGVPWVLFQLFLTSLVAGRGIIPEGRRFTFVFYGCSVTLAIGVGAAMLSTSGLAAPIGSAYFLKVMFDAAIMPRSRALKTLAVIGCGWLLVAVLGPADQLWVIPFQLALFGASFALGSIGYRAFDDVTNHSLSLARTDVLTSVRNRLGFEEEAEKHLAVARQGDGAFALLALDLDDFKGVNDTRGHAAGDALLRAAAAVLTGTLTDAQVIGRLGGDEFAIVVPLSERDAAARRASELTDALGEVVGASVGHAVFPHDGIDLEGLLSAADRRSYAAKRTRKAERFHDVDPDVAVA